MTEPITTLTDLKRRLEAEGAVTRPPADMPPQVRRLCPGAEEIMVLECDAVAAWIDPGSWHIYQNAGNRPLEIHDLPAVVMWR